MNQRYRYKNKMNVMKVMRENLPNAWVVSSHDRGRKKIIGKNDKKVFLKKSEEFEIELYNPTNKSVLADIKLNGSSISKSGLILRPGERVYLDCFIDDRRKFIFETYEVDNTEESKKAIELNGLLEVFFYKEETISINNWSNKFNKIVIERYYPYYQPWYNPYDYPYTTPTIWYGNNTLNNTSGTVNVGNLLNTTSSSTNISYSTFGGISNTSNPLNNNLQGTLSLNNSIETGRVEKSDKSKQKFESVYMDFEKNYISSVIVKLLPESLKPVDVKKKKKKNKKSEDVYDIIRKLHELYEDGILTENEFNDKKSELLSKI